jgi:hypothetical protein
MGNDMKKLYSLPDKQYWLTFLFVFMSWFATPLWADSDYIGMVKTYQPLAGIVHGGVEAPVNVGLKLYAGDIVVTHTDAAVGIIFMDGSVLSLGPESRFEIVDFLFKPAERQVSFVSKVIKGTVAFSSGAIGRISPESVKFITPTSTLSLHGTKVLIEVK